MLSRWLELGKIKHSAVLVSSSTHPRGMIQGRAGFMLPAEAEMKVMVIFCAETPVAQCRSGIWGETGGQSSATGALSAFVPPNNKVTQPRVELGKEWCLKLLLTPKTGPAPREVRTQFITPGNCTDADLGVSTPQACSRMPFAPLASLLGLPPCNAQQL